MKKIKLITPILLGLTTISSSLIPLTACTQKIQAVDFLTCSWEEINTWCEKLESGKINDSEFCAHFTIGNKIVKSLSDFNGLDTRTIKINNQDHYVRIIGQKHDVIADGTLKGKKATFTFELKTLLSQENGYALPSIVDWTSNINYLNSRLRNNLTGTNDQASWGFPAIEGQNKTAMQMLPKEITSIIKSVAKKVAISDDAGVTYKVTDYNDKLFVLTRTEMAQVHEEGTYWNVEGEPYEFWINNEKLGEQEKCDGRAKMDCKHNGFGYWLSTPITTSDKYLSCVTNDGRVSYSSTSNSETVSFAFCI